MIPAKHEFYNRFTVAEVTGYDDDFPSRIAGGCRGEMIRAQRRYSQSGNDQDEMVEK